MGSTINNVDINLRIIFERNLRYHTRHFLQQLASYGFNRDTLEWFVSDIVGKNSFLTINMNWIISILMKSNVLNFE